MARLASLAAIQIAALGASVWYEWVPSKANIADIPSRDTVSSALALLPKAARREFKFPPKVAWADLSFWMQCSLQARGELLGGLDVKPQGGPRLPSGLARSSPLDSTTTKSLA